MTTQQTDRLHALDAVRAFALLSGIALHATMPWLQDLKGWATVEPPSDALAVVWYVIHMFRMAVFMLIGGFFGRMVLERRGTKAFVKDRAKRILIPLIVAPPVVGISTLILFVLAALASGMDWKDLQALGQQRQAQATASGAQSVLNLSDRW